MLKLFADDPEDCWEQYVAPPELRVRREPTPSMIWGSNFERLVFYDRLDAILIPQDVLNSDGHRKGGKWLEFKGRMDEEKPGQQLLTQKEWDSQIMPLLVARDKARSHDAAAKLLWGAGEAHVSIVWDDVSTGVVLPCKCQLDLLHDRGIICDLKTARQDALGSRQALAAHLLKFRYHIQAWWYTHAVLGLTGKLCPFVFVFVGSKRPHGVQVVEMTEPWMTLAENQVRTYLGQLSQAWQSGVWKPAGFGQIQKIDPPHWSDRWLEDSWMFGGAGE